MGKQPVQGQKKSKDSIAKAASQAKGPAKVIDISCRNGTREKSRKRLITQSSSTEPLTIDLLLVSPNSESTSLFQESSKNIKSLDQSPDNYLEHASKMDQSDQSKDTASKPFTVQ